MVHKPFESAGLKTLCSEDQLDLLDSIDYLRSQGISHYVSLPQIIVCGDQSSGKSAVLEAISGVSFPIKSNLCTRFPTELILRKNPVKGVSVSIVPHHERSEEQRHALARFHETLEDFDGLPTLIENAKGAMGITTHGKAFSKDLLRVEVSGPDRPHLTIVDLPGLIHSETKQQSGSDVELVQEVVEAYMMAPRSIILAVVSAKNDYANQIVLKLARTADPSGRRTVGIVTKPDTLIAGSESEALYVSLAKNQDVEFRLGWHVLKNMDSEKGKSLLAERNSEEEEFFSKGIWTTMSPSLLGVEKIRPRLSKVLLVQIANELPSLMKEIETKSDICRSRLVALGDPRTTLEEQRVYLLNASQSFQTLIKAAVDGTYNDPFFENALLDIGFEKRIRAVIRNLNDDFRNTMTTRGHRRQIVDAVKSASFVNGVTLITRDKYIDHIEILTEHTRGRELPTTFNPMIVADLFLEQSTQWADLTQDHVDITWKSARTFLSHVARYISDPNTSKALFQEVFEPSLKTLLGGLNQKMMDVLWLHQKGHPITYNEQFVETLKKFRAERWRVHYAAILRSYTQSLAIDSARLLKDLVEASVGDLQRSACSDVLDCMQAYYQIALDRFVDDVAVEVVDVKLLNPLLDIFSPLSVYTMSASLITRIAGESEENRLRREQLVTQLDVLTKGYETCKRFIGASFFDAGMEELQIEDDEIFDAEEEPDASSHDPADDAEEDDLPDENNTRELVITETGSPSHRRRI